MRYAHGVIALALASSCGVKKEDQRSKAQQAATAEADATTTIQSDLQAAMDALSPKDREAFETVVDEYAKGSGLKLLDMTNRTQTIQAPDGTVVTTTANDPYTPPMMPDAPSGQGGHDAGQSDCGSCHAGMASTVDPIPPVTTVVIDPVTIDPVDGDPVVIAPVVIEDDVEAVDDDIVPPLAPTQQPPTQQPPIAGTVTTVVPVAVTVTAPIPGGPAVNVNILPPTLTVSGGVCVRDDVVSATGSVQLTVPFNGSVPLTHIKDVRVIRNHQIFVGGSFAGSVDLGLAGSITATATSWTAKIDVSGNANVAATVQAEQLLGRREAQFSIGTAVVQGTASFKDSITYTQTCAPAGVLVTTPGVPSVAVTAQIVAATFGGFFFPRVQGPAFTAIRGAIVDWAVPFANSKIGPMIQSSVFSANQAYEAKKQVLLAQLVKALPPGCGCRALPVLVAGANVATDVLLPAPTTTTVIPPTTTAPLPQCACSESGGQCVLSHSGRTFPLGPSPGSCAQLCSDRAAASGCRF